MWAQKGGFFDVAAGGVRHTLVVPVLGWALMSLYSMIPVQGVALMALCTTDRARNKLLSAQTWYVLERAAVCAIYFRGLPVVGWALMAPYDDATVLGVALMAV